MPTLFRILYLLGRLLLWFVAIVAIVASLFMIGVSFLWSGTQLPDGSYDLKIPETLFIYWSKAFFYWAVVYVALTWGRLLRAYQKKTSFEMRTFYRTKRMGIAILLAEGLLGIAKLVAIYSHYPKAEVTLGPGIITDTLGYIDINFTWLGVAFGLVMLLHSRMIRQWLIEKQDLELTW